MINYIIGIVFLILFIMFLVCLGKSTFSKFDDRNFSMNLLIGYTVYTFFQAVGGILVQVFQLNWFVFFWYMIITLVLLIIYVVYHQKKANLSFQNFKEHFKKYWFLYFVCAVLLVFSIINFEWVWMGNSMDDGRYLNLLATYPYTSNPYTTNAAHGLAEPFIFVRAINTFELEYSFWVYILRIDPSIFAKFVMNVFNYYLTLHAIYAFAKVVFKALKLEIKEKYIQFVVAPILFFGFYYSWLVDFNILQMQDSWQFNTAMWYGSSIVRITGAFLCITPILSHKKLDLFVVVYCFMISVGLMSKASQALPMLFILAIGYIVSMCFTAKDKKLWIIPIIIFIMLLFVPKIPIDFDEIEEAAMRIVDLNSSNFLWHFSFMMLIISFLFKNKIITKWNIILSTFVLLMWVPNLNKLFVDTSMYNFVAARTTTLFIFTIVITAFVYLFVTAKLLLKNSRIIAYSFLALGIGLSGFMVFEYRKTIGLKRGAATLIRNPYLFPRGTYDLSHELQNLSEELGKELNVLSQNGVGSNGYVHALSISLRTYAPDINSISAIPRYSSIDASSPFNDFSQEEQWIFEAFNTNPSNLENVEKFERLLEKYPIDCVIAVKEESRDLLIEMGFKEYKQIEVVTDAFTHYIMYK